MGNCISELHSRQKPIAEGSSVSSEHLPNLSVTQGSTMALLTTRDATQLPSPIHAFEAPFKVHQVFLRESFCQWPSKAQFCPFRLIIFTASVRNQAWNSSRC